MDKIISSDNELFIQIRKICDLVVLSILWVLFVLPLITAGPATCALYYSVVKSIRRQRSYPIKEFFRGFRTNFKMGIQVGIFLIILNSMMLFTVYPWFLTSLLNDNKAKILLIIFFSLECYILLGITLVIFPVLSRFSIKFIPLVELSFFSCFSNMIRSIGMVIIFLTSVLLILLEPLLLIILPGITCVMLSLLIEPILKKITRKVQQKDISVHDDAWYMES